MSHPLRRSARLANPSYEQQHRSASSAPAFSHPSQPSSTSTSSFPSPTNDTNPPPQHLQSQSQPRLQVKPSFMPQHNPHLNVPLPSPSAGDVEPFFGRPHSQPNPYSSHSHQPHQQHQQQPQSLQPPQQQQHVHHNSFSQHGIQQQSQGGAMPQDFLAEAAKRAQMACLMRDLGDVEL